MFVLSFIFQVALKVYKEGGAFELARKKEILLLGLVQELLPEERKSLLGQFHGG